MDTSQVQAAISALYGSNAAEAERANTFLMEFTEQPVGTEMVIPFFSRSNSQYIESCSYPCSVDCFLGHIG